MLSRIFSLALLLTVGGHLYAQDQDPETELPPEAGVEIKNVHQADFQGVRHIPQRGYVYVGPSQGDETKTISAYFYNYDLEEVKVHRLPVPSNSQLVGYVVNKFYTLVATYDPKKKANHYTVFNSKGSQISTRAVPTKVPYEPGNQLLLSAPNDQGFIIVQVGKGSRDGGYIFERVDLDLKTLWRNNVNTTAPLASITYGVAKGNHVLIVAHEKSPDGKSFTERLVCVDVLDGEFKFLKTLYDDQYTMFPTYIDVDNEQNILLAGHYQKGEKWDFSDPTGLYFQKMTFRAQVLAESFTPWSEIAKMLDKKANPGNARLLAYEIVRTPEGYKVGGEVFTAGARPAAIKPGATFTWKSRDLVWLHYGEEEFKLEKIEVMGRNELKNQMGHSQMYLSDAMLATAAHHGLGSFGFTDSDGNLTVLEKGSGKAAPYQGYYISQRADSDGTPSYIDVSGRFVGKGNTISDNDMVGILPAEGGKVLLYVVSRDKKSLRMLILGPDDESPAAEESTE